MGKWWLAAARNAFLPGVSRESGMKALKEVSRSFYLSLRLLPREMRAAASVGYLLARTSDTIADSAQAAVELRLAALEEFKSALLGESPAPRWTSALLNGIVDPSERRLMETTADWIAWLNALPAEERRLVREVVEIIIGGQQLDLRRFATADAENPVALADEAELEDYTWRVAGCVGAFWTKLGFLTMGKRFSHEDETRLLELGVRYGKALQLVNILRDLPADLRDGRCYLPVADPRDRALLMEQHRRWTDIAREWIGDGLRYADALCSRRLRSASVLPAMIGRETLARLATVDWQTLEARVKVPRSGIYRALIVSFLKRPSI